MKNKLRLARIIILGIAVSTAIFSVQTNLATRTAYAIGDLTVDWGVVEPNPIFVVNNAAPGDTEDRDVEVTNTAPSSRPVGVRGVETSETGNLSSVLEITISEGGTDLYGGTTGIKTLDQFFADSAGVDGAPLSELTSGENTTYNFKVVFPETAGNEFQNTSVVFDLIIGISIPVPEECVGIEFSADPIFGTAKAENLKGTDGNDLIFALEGADKVEGLGGDDCIVGGEGADRLNGNAGDDVILGQNGSDSLIGNNGEDRLFGGDGSDSLDGGNENDRLEGGAGSDNLKSGNGEDILIGGTGSDSLDGGNDLDQLFGNEGSDSLKGDNGDDFLDGGPNIDSLKGGAGTDTCLNGEALSGCEN